MTTQLELGERLKKEGQERALIPNCEWIEGAIGTIKRFAMSGKQFTAEDVRTLCGLEPSNPNAWGAAFSAAAKQGIIVRVGYRKNSMPSAHARVVAVWKGLSR